MIYTVHIGNLDATDDNAIPLFRTPLHCAADVGNLEIWQANWKRKCKTKQLISYLTSTNQQSADQGLMIRNSVPEEPTGETDSST